MTSIQDEILNLMLDKGNAKGPRIGEVEKGNIDLQHRPTTYFNDGTYGTVRSMSFNDGQNEVVIPTLQDNGQPMSEQEAIEYYFNTGQHLGKFNSVDAAENFAQKLHEAQSDLYGGPKNINEIVIDQLMKEAQK